MDDDVLISKSFKLLGSEGKTALIPYVTAGYPNRDATVPLLERLKEVGADIIELGIPFLTHWQMVLRSSAHRSWH